MLVDIDNKGAVELATYWSVGGQTRYVDLKQHFLWELKEEVLLQIQYVPRYEKMQIFSQRKIQGLHLRSLFKCTVK